MCTMELVSTLFTIFVCLLCILVKVDSRYSTHHSPNDRPKHSRPHNLHRAPYKGYDWDKIGYERNLEPVHGLPKSTRKTDQSHRNSQKYSVGHHQDKSHHPKI